MAASASLEDILPSVHAFLRIVNERFPTQRAYLFGSYASGRARPESDVDLAIVSEAFREDQQFENNAALSALTWGIDTRIEPLALRPEALNTHTPLMAEIRRHGLLVYRAEDEKATDL